MNRIWCLSKKYLQDVGQSVTFCTSVKYLPLKAESLTTRSLIKISGDDVYSFLQGLITNDITHLNERRSSLFTLFLNNKGRVICDSILYRYNNENTLWIECDSKIEKDLKCHLKYFRVRKKIEIETASEKLWVIFSNDECIPLASNKYSDVRNIEQMTVCRGLPLQSDLNYDVHLKQILSGLPVAVYKDPRMHLLGTRIIVMQDIDLADALVKLNVDLNAEGLNYTMLRYKLGVGEGISELPVEKCFPLEINCDYLHGISFHKGCYIGQELTARTHHTGVVRKRLMPLIFSSTPDLNLPHDSPIEVRDGYKNAGKLRGQCGRYGIGLLRISEVLEAPTNLMVNKFPVSTFRPIWWPHQTQSSLTGVDKE